jgi:hypothetical protein
LIKKYKLLVPLLIFTNALYAQVSNSFKFLDLPVTVNYTQHLYKSYNGNLSDTGIYQYYEHLKAHINPSVIDTLLNFKNKNKLDDWYYYQLIRKTAQQVSAKEINYYSYTLYKWYLLLKSGYNSVLRISASKMLLYIQTNENIYNIPGIIHNNKPYICLNYHDYGTVNFDIEQFKTVELLGKENTKAFSYKIMLLPDFNPSYYINKDLQFTYRNNEYKFNIKLNPQIKELFLNYPVIDYKDYFDVPLSKTTYASLVPFLKKAVEKKSVIKGVDFLMRFTRNSFVFEADTFVYGKEKRLFAEATLLFEQSDCEDRSALFFYLVKEIYDLPMLVLSYPRHVTVAVKLPLKKGDKILYKNNQYFICEPTPQNKNLKIGNGIKELRNTAFEIVYEYKTNN